MVSSQDITWSLIKINITWYCVLSNISTRKGLTPERSFWRTPELTENLIEVQDTRSTHGLIHPRDLHIQAHQESWEIIGWQWLGRHIYRDDPVLEESKSKQGISLVFCLWLKDLLHVISTKFPSHDLPSFLPSFLPVPYMVIYQISGLVDVTCYCSLTEVFKSFPCLFLT